MPLVDRTYLLDGNTLSVGDLDMIVNEKIKIDLTPEAWQKVKLSREIIHRMMSDNTKVVYGINTGFGNFADKIISYDERAQLQLNLIRSHSVCVGEPLPLPTVKRMTILRINTLAKGRSGFEAQNLLRYIHACNEDYFPMIPEKGTVGASGDLAPLAHLALGMIGEGKAWDEQKREFVEAAEIMRRKQLKPIQLHEKQGLALINGTQFMTGIITEIQAIAGRLAQSALVVFAFAAEIFGMQLQLLEPEVVQYYSNAQSSLGETLSKLKQYLDIGGSELHLHRLQESAHRNNQSHSVILALENISSLVETLNLVRRILNEEINSATDNPLVYSKEEGFEVDMLISAGNFHGEYVAKAADFLSMALLGLGKFSEARIQRYVNERTSNLPGFLTKKGGLNSGYMIIQYTSAALLSQSKALAKPASADSISTSACQEDHVSMGGYAARKCRQMLDNISYILGIQFMCALQAVDLIAKKPSQRLMRVHERARKFIRHVEQDSYFGPDIEVAKQLVQEGLADN